MRRLAARTRPRLVTPRLVTAGLVVAVLVLATGCTDGDDATPTAPDTTTSSTSATTTAETTATTGTGDEPATPPSNPEGEPTDNALHILGDTLGIVDSCAGRSETGDVEYRYGLTNDGTLVITLRAGRVVRVVYDGRSGVFSGANAELGEADTGDGFVTGTGTLDDDAGTTTEIAYRATVPLLNCADAATTSTSAVDGGT